MNTDDLINKIYEQIHMIEERLHDAEIINSNDVNNHYLGQIQGLELAITLIEKEFHRFTPIERV